MLASLLLDGYVHSGAPSCHSCQDQGTCGAGNGQAAVATHDVSAKAADAMVGL